MFTLTQEVCITESINVNSTKQITIHMKQFLDFPSKFSTTKTGCRSFKKYGPLPTDPWQTGPISRRSGSRPNGLFFLNGA